MGKEVKMNITRSIKRKDAPPCQHLNVEVDIQKRVVNCTHCESVIDPFEYILSWANQEKRYELEVEYKKRELLQVMNELNELKKSVSLRKKES